MKGEVTLKKTSETKFTVYLDDEKIGELNQVEESVDREDSVAYLWLWDPSDDRFRDRALENGGYYNPNKLFSELKELIARTPEKEGKKAMVKWHGKVAATDRLFSDLERIVSNHGGQFKSYKPYPEAENVLNAHIRDVGSKRETISAWRKLVQEIDRTLSPEHNLKVEYNEWAPLGLGADFEDRETGKKLIGVSGFAILDPGKLGSLLVSYEGGEVGFEASSAPEKKGKKAMLRKRTRFARGEVNEDRKYELVMAAIGEWVAGGAEGAGGKVKNTGYSGQEQKWFEANRPLIQKLCEDADNQIWEMVKYLDLP